LSYRLLIRPRAERDLVEVQQWYEAQRPGLGREFRAEVDKILAQLPDHPLMYPLVQARTRRAVVGRFPYLLFYLIAGDLISVIACFHGHRDPKLLRSRLR
jgi:plasmid stabilization system protein ParE